MVGERSPLGSDRRDSGSTLALAAHFVQCLSRITTPNYSKQRFYLTVNCRRTKHVRNSGFRFRYSHSCPHPPGEYAAPAEVYSGLNEMVRTTHFSLENIVDIVQIYVQ